MGMGDMKQRVIIVVALVCGAQSPGCGDDGSPGETQVTADKDAMSASISDTGVFGSVTVSLSAGNGVPSLAAGKETGTVVDGWSVEYTRLLVTIGDFEATVVGADGTDYPLGDGRVQVVDLMAASGEGEVLHGFDAVGAGAAEYVGFALVNADDATGSGLVSDGDYALMVKNRYALFIEGSMRNPAGRTCTPGVPGECEPAPEIRFAWGLPVATAYARCGDGFQVAHGESTAVTLTLPGDRWFRTDFGAGRTEYRAQWIADADLDRDGETTLAELEQVAARDVLPAGSYRLDGAIVPIETARHFLEAQARAIGSAGAGNCRMRPL